MTEPTPAPIPSEPPAVPGPAVPAPMTNTPPINPPQYGPPQYGPPQYAAPPQYGHAPQYAPPPHYAAPPPPPPTPRKSQGRSIAVLIAVGLVLSLAVIFVIARLQAGEQRFPDGWLAYKWTVPQGATSAQIADAQLVLQEELAHLGATQVRTVVDGRDIHVGVPNDDGGSAIMTVGTRRLTPQVSLRVETGGEPTSMDPHNANLKRGDACYTPEAEFTACDFTRTFVASFAGEIVGGDLIADAQAVEPSGTPSPIPGSDGDWSVVVRFTPDGATQVGNAVSHTSKAQPVLVFIATIDSSDPFGLSRMVNGPGVAIDASNVAHLNGLSQVEAQRIAATLRLSRSTFAMAGGDFE